MFLTLGASQCEPKSSPRLQASKMLALLLRCTFYNPYTARLSESEKNVHLKNVASSDSGSESSSVSAAAFAKRLPLGEAQIAASWRLISCTWAVSQA